jgi:hypothetical protein
MADVTQIIIEPAVSHALITLDKFKIATGMPAGPSSTDEQMQWLIDTQSHVIARLCNRIFARETLIERWRDLGGDVRRLYLTHWPVKQSDIARVSTNGADRLNDWELDEREGKLSVFTNRAEPIEVEYTGGYLLPDEAPLPLQQAVALLVNTSKAEQASAALTGVRMISHKESRVMFHTPTSGGSTSSSGPSSSQTQSTVSALLGHYIKHWI